MILFKKEKKTEWYFKSEELTDAEFVKVLKYNFHCGELKFWSKPTNIPKSAIKKLRSREIEW